MTICNWETNRTSPQLRFIPRIIAVLGYNPYDVQSGALAKRIVACRRAMGLTQRELARHLGVDPSTLRLWETRQGQPSAGLGEQLTALFHKAQEDVGGH